MCETKIASNAWNRIDKIFHYFSSRCCPVWDPYKLAEQFNHVSFFKIIGRYNSDPLVVKTLRIGPLDVFPDPCLFVRLPEKKER